MGSNKDIAIRFAVGHPDSEISSTWRIWFNKPAEEATSDVYLSYRALGGTLKVSIHQSGSIQYSFTGEHARKLNIPNKERHLDQWDLQGRYPIFKIIVPFTELKAAKAKIKKKIKSIDAPSNGNAVEIYLYITNDSIGDKMPKDYKLFEEHVLNNGKTFSIIWRNNPITENNSRLYLSRKEILKQVVVENELTGEDLRGFLYLRNGDHERHY